MEHLKEVCVIIPCHNYGEYVELAIDSAINQDYNGEISIVVIDDGSVDNTNLVINNLITKNNEFLTNHMHGIGYDCFTGLNSSAFRKLHLVTIPDATGPSHARNVGLRYMLEIFPDTEIVAFLDADDMMVVNKLSTLVPVFDDVGIGAVYADYYHLYDDGKFQLELKEPFDIMRFVQENIGPNNTSLVTVEALLEIKEGNNFYEPTMRTCEDYDLFMRVAEKYMIKHVAEPLTFLRVHNNNSTSTVDMSVWQKDRNRVSQRIRERMYAESK